MALRLHLFGNLIVERDGAILSLAEWRSLKAQYLLKLLALQPEGRLAKEQAIELLWPASSPEAASANLYRTLHELRRTLEPENGRPQRSRFVLMRGGQLLLRHDDELWVDTWTFDALVAQARGERDPIPVLSSAVALYRGPLLADSPYEEWAQAPRAFYEQRYIDALRALLRAQGARGADEAVIEAGLRLLDVDPTDEEAHRALMRSYARLGRRAAAVRQYERCVELLIAELQATPAPETTALYEAIRGGRWSDAAPHATAPVAPQDSPLTPALFGREAELARVLALLARPGVRLVTLTGVPGVGKSRLAAHAATEYRARTGREAAAVDLSAVSGETALLGAIGAALAVELAPDKPLLASLQDALAGRPQLVLLDTFEHLTALSVILVELLRGAPGLQLLVTSRTTLSLAGEYVVVVPPLELPDLRAPLELADLAAVPAVALFLYQARLARPGFMLTAENARDAAAICVCLDGLPLAIELVAARVRLLTPAEILGQLGDGLGLVRGERRPGPERHISLAAALEWSYRLLSPTEQSLFVQLAVMERGWDLEFATAIVRLEGDGAADAADLIDALDSLLAHQLVQREDGRAERSQFAMLDTVQLFARELLARAGAGAALRRRHALAVHALVLAEARQRVDTGPGGAAWLERLADLYPNIAAALRWCVAEGEIELAAQTASRLGYFWYVRHHPSEGLAWSRLLIAKLHEVEPSLAPALRARLLKMGGSFAMIANQAQLAESWLLRSLAASREAGDRTVEASALLDLGALADRRGDEAVAEARLLSALNTLQELDDRRGAATAMLNLGVFSMRRGNHERAEALFVEALAHYEALGDSPYQAMLMANLTGLAVRRGDLARAAHYAHRGVLLGAKLHSPGLTGENMQELAAVLPDPEVAARVLGASAQLRRASGHPYDAEEERLVAELERRLRSAAGATIFAAAYAQGEAMTLEAAVAYALAVSRAHDRGGSSGPRPVA